MRGSSHYRDTLCHVFVIAIVSNGKKTTWLCENENQAYVDDAGESAQRGTVPQLSGRRLLAVDGMLEVGYERGLRRAVRE